MRLDGQDYWRLGLHGTCLTGMDRWAKWVEDDSARLEAAREKGVVVRLRWVAKSPTSPKPQKVVTAETIAKARKAGQISEEMYRSLLKRFV
jgi:hypothetical protein